MKNLGIILTICCALFNLTATAHANEETEPAVSSNLINISLPANALRVLPQSVPPVITETLEKVVAAGESKFRQGGTEVLIWTGANYKKANAATIIYRLTDTIKVDGWKYETSGEENGVTVFAALKDGTKRRALIGLYGATDEALIFAWTEIFAANGASNGTVGNNSQTENLPSSPVQNNGSSSEIVGIWRTGGMSTLGDKNMVTGAITPSNGNTFKYVFTPDGRFEFVGMIQSTLYGCTTTLFNDKRGRFELRGSQLTLIPSKNYWKNTYSCSPASNKERDYTLERETFEMRTKTDEYGKLFICLSNAKGETCYRKEKE